MATAQELDALVESGELTVEGYSGQTYSLDGWTDLKYELGKDGTDTSLGRLAVADEFGGMDQGSDYWVVVSLTAPDGTVQYFKKDGWYASHDGGYLDGDLYEVESYERTVTDWRSKK